jgi:orotate phosphoribosyltransferase
MSVAADLLSIQAVFLRPDDPFTWASGIKSPIYCDNRLILSDPDVRRRVEDQLAQMIREEFPEVQVLMGTATAGIAHAALAAERLDLPMGYVRGGSKDHGRGNQIEGRLEAGQKVVVVEDLISTGGSVLDAVAALRDAGAEVLGIAALFSYGMQKATDRMKEAGVQYVALSNLDELVKVATDSGYVTPGQATSILNFRDNPAGWSK